MEHPVPDFHAERKEKSPALVKAGLAFYDLRRSNGS
jgi:hypothetical protein